MENLFFFVKPSNPGSLVPIIKHSVAFMQTHYQIPLAHCLKSTSPNSPSFRSSLEQSYLCRLRMLPRFLYRAMPVTNVEASSGSALGKKQRYSQGLTWDLAYGRNSKNKLRDLQGRSSKQSGKTCLGNKSNDHLFYKSSRFFLYRLLSADQCFSVFFVDLAS